MQHRRLPVMIFLPTARRWQAFAILTTLCLCCGYAPAQDPAPAPLLDDMYHSAWTVRDGVPPSIWQAKQTTDGFLWLASATGLYRFDGIAFVKYQPPSGQKLLKEGPITALAPTADGGLWIAYRYGGASFIRSNSLTNYPASREFSQTAFILTQDPDGFIWGGTTLGLVRFDGKQWSRVTEAWGPKIAAVNHLRLDPVGNLWVDDGKAYYVLPRGGHQFQATGIANGKIDILSANAGWTTRDDVGLFPLTRSAQGTWAVGRQAMTRNISAITNTPDGSLWVGAHDGIWRLRSANPASTAPLAPNQVQAFRKADGLTDDWVYALTVDREGSLWTITPNGLDQFRRTAFTSVTLPPDMHHLLVVNEGDSILIASAFHAKSMLMRVSAQGSEPVKTPFVAIHQMYLDPSGTVWINADGDLWSLAGSKLTRVPRPRDFPETKFTVQAMTMDLSGTLWVSVSTDRPDKIYCLSHGSWNLFHGAANPSNTTVTSMMTDNAGRVWMGAGPSLLTLVDPSGVHRLGREQGLESGAITAMTEHGDHVWIGGTEHLSFYANGRFRKVLSDTGTALSGVTGIVETESGDLWLNATSGIVKIEAAEIRNALSSGVFRLRMRTFNYLDGYAAAPSVLPQSSTATQTSDGRLFFLAREGVSWIDPAHIERNTIPPHVAVTSVIADRQTYENPTQLDLPQGAQNLQINYTATSLLIPARVQFCYKLEGFDKEWQEVGTRRQAFYTGLPPAHYTFLVMASNNDGVWSTVPVRWEFQLPPTFLQSLSFKLLCFMAFVLLLTFLYLFRVKMLTAKIQTRLFERLAERERIARDLHDTFFQSIQGLFLRFNTGTAMLPAEEPARKIFKEALEQSDRVMAEGRELVLDLRAEESTTLDLAEELAQIGEQSLDLKKPAYQVITVGEVRTLHPVCATELIRIGREAVYNAFRHAQAEAVEVEILYEKDLLKLRIRDDGQGIEEHVMQNGRRPGHMGLVGMSERAQSIGARYNIWSKRGKGTEIEVAVPAGIAYAPAKATTAQRLSRGFRMNVWRA